MKIEFLADHPQFIPVLAKWYFDEWGHAFAHNSVQKTIDSISGKLNKNKAPLYLIATDENQVVGAIQIKTKAPDDYWLEAVYVPIGNRHKGIAKNLCLQALEVARSFNAKELKLETAAIETGGLYQQIGWKPIKKYQKDGRDLLLMTYPLKA